MTSSSKRSAVAAALILTVGAALAGCGGDDSADASGDATATPAWDSTPADPGAAPAEPDETSAATETPAETPAADGGQPAAEGGEAAEQPGGDASGDGGTAAGGDGGGDAAGEAPASGDDGGTGGAGGTAAGAEDGTEDPPPAAQPVDACTLGAEAITGVLGAGATTEDLSASDGFGPACGWTGSGGHEVIVTVAGFDDWISMDDLLGGGAQAVDDLGTEAWASLESPSNVQVAWRRDDISVALAASLESGGEAMLDIARVIDAELLEAGY